MVRCLCWPCGCAGCNSRHGNEVVVEWRRRFVAWAWPGKAKQLVVMCHCSGCVAVCHALKGIKVSSSRGLRNAALPCGAGASNLIRFAASLQGLHGVATSWEVSVAAVVRHWKHLVHGGGNGARGVALKGLYHLPGPLPTRPPAISPSADPTRAVLPSECLLVMRNQVTLYMVVHYHSIPLIHLTRM